MGGLGIENLEASIKLAKLLWLKRSSIPDSQFPIPDSQSLIPLPYFTQISQAFHIGPPQGVGIQP